MRDAPSVRNDVVAAPHQVVTILGEPQKAQPLKRALLEIEGPLTVPGMEIGNRSPLRLRLEVRQIVEGELGRELF